ncbi:MarR family winged helix-turn-helix transcriptional regulator [Puia dinghuensis]|uniref:MarR family transcriptional regulator n=1 Tax=Puia dinghuensis TaxID=1792502 RepID=A0A8J2UC43_9BACT|nr:MarR family transcriptional regulator [Puia dinghuensis]GGA97110.1 MarR family transcriptional regulator [Puia dinghuensis]
MKSPIAPDAITHGPGSRDIELASNFRITIHRLVKLLRRQTRNDAQLSLTERSTLGLLYPDAQLAPSDIARTEKVTTQSMSQVINHLAELSYIEKTPSGEDKRKVLLSLTAAGKAYVEQIRQDKQEWLARAMQEKLTPAEKDTLAAALNILTKLIDE